MTLPYEFDTSSVVRTIGRGVVGFFLLILAGLFYSVLISHDSSAALGLLLVLAIAGYFGRLFLRNLTGSVGTITREVVTVQPGRVCGLRMASPAGTFPLGQFKAVCVERISAGGEPIDAQRGAHERVSLVGLSGTPTILVARTDADAGRALGRELATELTLPYQEQLAPY
jgi:hypothetical protein